MPLGRKRALLVGIEDYRAGASWRLDGPTSDALGFAELLVKDEYKILTAMMPCTIAVYEKSDGKTYISLMNLDLMGAMYGGDVAEMAKELGPQMDAMVNLK